MCDYLSILRVWLLLVVVVTATFLPDIYLLIYIKKFQRAFLFSIFFFVCFCVEVFAVVGGVVVAVDCGKKLLHFVLTLNLILDTENRFFVSSYVHIYICMYIYVCILLIPSISQ